MTNAGDVGVQQAGRAAGVRLPGGRSADRRHEWALRHRRRPAPQPRPPPDRGPPKSN